MSARAQSDGGVLVTDASTDFGREIALTLAECGFTVFAGVPGQDREDRLDVESEQRNAAVIRVDLDVSDEPGVIKAIDAIYDRGHQIYGVVNSASMFLRGFFEDLEEEEIRAVFDTNLFGCMTVTRAVVPRMRLAGRGRIVIISSVAGRIGAPTGSAYSASRFGQEGFAESLRQELQPLGIFVSLVEPGITPTKDWTIEKCRGVNTSRRDSPYFEWFQRSEVMFENAMKNSKTTTRDVALTVRKALCARHPRWRYMVGLKARLLIGLLRYLPGEFATRQYFAQVVRRVTGGSRVR